MHPDIHLALHHARAAELRAETEPRPVGRPALRTRLGWILVEVGLKLATPPGPAATAH
ncbi:predicted protein [Streptomyces viridochromogenes DSM 40736]|uniref:Predicted protein n=1 Tax=Streptomyces viridochromogenes (strain DSM 40736 / JCM 4977 / BCRC 1201 / Tue 494) TaxID=591159 RepID=D9XCK7_STRVT|nr:hypothetical protein [Streptomyces viridochromogenes]EFL32464.1 predicted protein [Streptomyces viridochromogenes DSM 40736]